jgi:hypothetical protein
MQEDAGQKACSTEEQSKRVMVFTFQLDPEMERTLATFEAALDAMTVYSDKVPVLPLDAFRRDEIYRDHD